jgi:hypothetical protein
VNVEPFNPGINYLLCKEALFVIKAPFWKLLFLKEALRQGKRWFRIDETWSYSWIREPIEFIEYEHYALWLW